MNTRSGSAISRSKIRYMRPMNFSVNVTPYATAGAVCLAPGRLAIPCREFLVQSDINNGSQISIGFSGTNLINGLQLSGGQGWVFAISRSSLTSSVEATPSNWVQGLEQAREALLKNSSAKVDSLMLNIADFWAAGAGIANQNLIVFYYVEPDAGA